MEAIKNQFMTSQTQTCEIFGLKLLLMLQTQVNCYNNYCCHCLPFIFLFTGQVDGVFVDRGQANANQVFFLRFFFSFFYTNINYNINNNIILV